MLGWALAFLTVAIIAGVLGFGGIAGAAAGLPTLAQTTVRHGGLHDGVEDVDEIVRETPSSGSTDPGERWSPRQGLARSPAGIQTRSQRESASAGLAHPLLDIRKAARD